MEWSKIIEVLIVTAGAVLAAWIAARLEMFRREGRERDRKKFKRLAKIKAAAIRAAEEAKAAKEAAAEVAAKLKNGEMKP